MSEVPAARSRFPFGLTIATAIAFAILCGLGTWQLQRLHWKRGARANPFADGAAEVRVKFLRRLARSQTDCSAALGQEPFEKLLPVY